MADIYRMARDLGAALARTDEYQSLKRANEAADEDRPLVEVRNRLQGLEDRIEAALRSGREPEDDVKEAYEAALSELQAMSVFQRVVAAQSNFEKVMYKVNQTVAEGINEGSHSRIIVSS